MRIMYWTGERLRQGGGTVHVVEMVQNLVDLGHEVFLVIPKTKKAPSSSTGLFVLMVPTLWNKLVSYIWFELTALCIVPYARYRFRVDAVYSRFGPATIVLPILCRLLGIPYVAEFNGLTGQELEARGCSKTLCAIADWVDRLNFRLASRSICVTQGILDALLVDTHTRGRRAMRAVVVGNGVNVEFFRPLDKRECRNLLGLDPGSFVVGFVGSIVPWQGVDLLVQAMHQVANECPKLQLVVVGDGESLPSLVEMTRGISGVRFVGRVPHETIPLYIGSFDLAYVCKTHLRGGFSPLKVYEYMASGRPVLANDYEGFKETVGQDCGLSFSTSDPGSLANVLRRAYQHVDELTEMGTRARKRAVAEFSWRVRAKETAEVIRDAVSEGRSGGEAGR